MDPQIDLLLQVLDQAYDRKAWHGTTLRGSLRGLSTTEALWRPSPQRHNIWELALHTAYWKYVVCRRLSGGERGQFPRGSDWPPLPDPADEGAWKEDLGLLRAQHLALRRAVAAFPPRRLHEQPPRSEWTYAALIYGASSHDLYHAGQIQLLKRMYRE